MRLQDTYRLDTSSLASGVLNGRHYGTALTAHDCFEIGRQTYNNGDYYHTNIWMEEALRLVNPVTSTVVFTDIRAGHATTSDNTSATTTTWPKNC